MVMDDVSASAACDYRFLSWLLVFVVIAATGCSTYVGTTAKSFLGHVRNNPDPNVRYLAYSKLGSSEAYDTEEQKREAVQTLIDKYQRGREPVATRAVICRTLGELREPVARDLLVKAVSSPEAIIKVEACRALGKVGRPEDATILAQVMTLDNLEDARIAAIEGLAELRTKDPRIFGVLLDGMDHEDPAIRLASLNALRKLIRKDYGTDPAAWRRELKPMLGGPAASASTEDARTKAPTAEPSARSAAPTKPQ
jgi:HEAT repeat protein